MVGATDTIQRSDQDWPSDEALPWLTRMAPKHAAATLAELGLDVRPSDVSVISHHVGKRCTLSIDASGTRFIAKTFAKPNQRLLGLYDHLHQLGRTDIVAPHTLARTQEGDLFITDRFAGQTLFDQLRSGDGEPGDGEQVGRRAAAWFSFAGAARSAATRRIDAVDLVDRLARRPTPQLSEALAVRIAALLAALASSMPDMASTALVHGSLRFQHMIDLGESIGVIDWDNARLGPIERDAATLLAQTHFLAATEPLIADAAESARGELLNEIIKHSDEQRLRWFVARSLVRLVVKLAPSTPNLDHVAHSLVDEAELCVG